MFLFHSFSLQLIALAAGIALLLFIKNQEKVKSPWACIGAWFIIIVSALGILFTSVYTIQFMSRGYDMQKFMMQKNVMDQ